jgi:hypothetical protein
MNIANPDRKADSELELRLQAYMALYHIHPEIKSPLVDEELVLDVDCREVGELQALPRSSWQPVLE